MRTDAQSTEPGANVARNYEKLSKNRPAWFFAFPAPRRSGHFYAGFLITRLSRAGRVL